MRSPRRAEPAPRQETVGEHLSHSFLRAHASDRLAAIADRLARERPSEVELVCAVDAHGALLGALPVSRLFAHAPSRTLGEVMRRDVPCARLHDDQEHAASLALHHDLDVLPVVDGDGRLAGVVGTHALLHVLRREHVEDLHRLAGIQREASRARHAIEDPPLRRFGHRVPWLVAGLAGSAIATAVMASFERSLAANVAIAFFIPAIVYLADAVGTQSEAIAVRGISLTRTGISHLLAGELAVGSLIGLALGGLAFVPVWAAFRDLALASAVGLSIWAASSIAAGLGLALPWLLARLGRDPAHGAGPIATVVQDTLSILVYFAVLRLLGVA